MNQEPIHYVQRATLCIVAQGAKIVMIGDDTYGYEAGQMAVYSIDVPMAGRVTRASRAEPYLLLMLDLDAEKIAELAPKVFPHSVPQPRDSRSLYVGDADAHIVDAATRLLELMAQPADAELLAPLVRDEILIRLLRSPLGSRVVQLGQAGSHVQRIAGAVSRLRANFDQTVSIEDAGRAGEHERHLVSPAIQGHHRHEPAAVPENAPAAGSAKADAGHDARRRQRRPARRLRQRVPVQPRIQPLLRQRAGERHPPLTRRGARAGGRTGVKLTARPYRGRALADIYASAKTPGPYGQR
jgi:hypothetical protein